MAQVATLAATGNWFHPNLVKLWGNEDVKRPPPKKLEVDLALIHQGMAAVVQVGTAHNAFEKHPDRCRVHGKTGTAQTKETIGSLPAHTSAWFIGWRNPAPGQGTGKKLAFACMVTHIISNRTGGDICAPIVAKFLREIR
jgi:cell division protein FtsI/penicillin-binding protein 2